MIAVIATLTIAILICYIFKGKPMKALLILLALATTAQAQHCHIQRFKQQVVHHGYQQQVVAVPAYGFAVGYHYQAEAMIEKAVQRALQQFRAEQQQYPTESLQAPPESPLSIESNFLDLMKSSCAKCHNAQKAAGGIRYDTETIDGITLFMGYRALGNGSMPKGSPLPKAAQAQYSQAAESLRLDLQEALK